MKKITLIFLVCLFYFSNIFCQSKTEFIFEKSKKEYKYILLSFGENSRTKPFKVFTCDSKNLTKIICSIEKYHKKYKLEFTDFYILSIDNKEIKDETLVYDYLNVIDEFRMKNNLSTILIDFDEYYDKSSKTKKYNYLDSRKKIESLKDLHQNIKPNEVEKLLITI